MLSYKELPLRVKEEFTAQQYNSELLVGSVQFGVVVLGGSSRNRQRCYTCKRELCHLW